MKKDGNYLLEASDIHKSYRMGLTDLKVLKGTNFAVEAGEFVCIVGASGSGKSTLLHILGTLDKPDSGIVKFKGKDLEMASNSEINVFRNKTVGFVFQFYHLLDELNVLENALLPVMVSSSMMGWLGRRNAAVNRATDLLDRLGLKERIKHKPYQLSGGERQRVAIARALINEPQVLLADEPTGNLDWATGNDILMVFEQLNKAGQTIIMVTHDDRIAARAKRVVRLTDGRVSES